MQCTSIFKFVQFSAQVHSSSGAGVHCAVLIKFIELFALRFRWMKEGSVWESEMNCVNREIACAYSSDLHLGILTGTL